LLKRISAAAIIALDTFMVVYAFADLFMVLYLGYSMPRGAVPWYYQKQIMSDGCIVWHVDTTPALVLASLIAPMGGIVFDRRITTKRRRGDSANNYSHYCRSNTECSWSYNSEIFSILSFIMQAMDL